MEIHFYETFMSKSTSMKPLLERIMVLATPKLLTLVICISLFPFISLASLITFENTNFSFSSFNPDMHDITYESDASASNQVIHLTEIQGDKRPLGSCGRATYKEPLHLWDKASGSLADFTAHFSFVVDSQNSISYSDGFAFFLTPNGSGIPPDSASGNLGLVSNNQSFNSMNSSRIVAIEYDTYTNFWDPLYDHVGINVNSMVSVNTVRWWSDIRGGRRTESWVSYNSTSKNLSVLLTDGLNIATLHNVIDLRDNLSEWVSFGFSACTTGKFFEEHTIFSWDFNSSLKISSNTPIPAGSSQKWLWVGLGVAGGCVLVGLVLFGRWMRRKRIEENDDGGSRVEENDDGGSRVEENDDRESSTERMDRPEEEFERVTGFRMFHVDELLAATNNFADDAMLGRGGSGSVYRGFINDTSVAVKRINSNTRQGMREYESEVRAISRLSHRNLVRLIGWCCGEENLLIVYEFMPNNDLYFHLFRRKDCLLTWEKRYKIALDLATALLYMQVDCQQCVLHRDIKSSNILLDSDFSAKLGDFGLARLVDHGQASLTTHVGWTPGYVAPEYSESREATKESDIYSFGIVALEIACGRQALEEVKENGEGFVIKLGEHVWEHYGRGNVLAVADPRLEGNYDGEQMERLIVVGLSCAHPDPNERPSIQLAIDRLNSRAPLPELPSEMPVRIRVAPPVNVSALSVSSYRTAND